MQVRTYRDLKLLPQKVTAFMVAAEARSIQLGPAWLLNLKETVLNPSGTSACVHVLEEQDEVIAVLPLQVGANNSLQSLSNYYSALYAPIFAPHLRAEALACMLREISALHGKITSFRLAPMDPEGREYQLLMTAMKLAGMKPFPFFCFGNWFTCPPNSLQQYLAHRSGNLRSNLKRRSRKFIESSGTLEVLHSPEDTVRATTAFQKVYSLSWKSAEPYPDFIPALIALCALRGWLRMGVLRLNGEPIAAQLWIVAHGRAEIYKVAYDERYDQYAPGTVLTAHLMQHVIENDGVREVDFLIGDDSYKRHWMDQRRERWGIMAYNPATLRGLAGWLKESTGRWLKTKLPRPVGETSKGAPVASSSA